MQDGSPGVQTPEYDLQLPEPGVSPETVQLSVRLPGVGSSTDIVVCAERRHVSVEVPGRYLLSLPLPVDICDQAESVKFQKKKGTLRAKFAVLRAGEGGGGGGGGAAGQGSGEEPRAAAAAELQRQQQQQLAEEQRRRREQLAREEAQRREQERQHNREAAREWIKRGADAAARGDLDYAARAAAKARELDPGVDGTPLVRELMRRRQQDPGRARGDAGAAEESSSSGGGGGQARPKPAAAAPPPQRPQPQQQQQPPPQRPPPPQQQQQQPPPQQPQRPQQQQQQPPQQPQRPQQPQQQQQPPPQQPQRPQRPQQQQQRPQQQQQRPQQQQQQRPPQGGGQPGPSPCEAPRYEGPSNPLVAAWCNGFERLLGLAVIWYERSRAWADVPGRGPAAAWVARTFALLVVTVPTLLVLLWQQAWLAPLRAAAAVRRAGGDSPAEAHYWLAGWCDRLWLRTLRSAVGKLSLAGLSAVAAWLLLQLLARTPVGGRSLVGWLWAAVWAGWCGVLWQPRKAVQLPIAVACVLFFGLGGLGGSVALWSVQALMLGGGWPGQVGCWLSVLAFVLRPRMQWRDCSAGASALALAADLAGRFLLLGDARWSELARRSPWAPGGAMLAVYLAATAALYFFHGPLAAPGGGGGGRPAGGGDEGWGAAEPACSRFVMGFGALAVPGGCKVAEVQAVLLAADYYEVMGFSFAEREAVTADALRLARRTRALAVHPDKVGHDHPGAHQAATRVNKAFETLGDPQLRRSYDQLVAMRQQPRGGGGSDAQGFAQGFASAPPPAGFSHDLYERAPDRPGCTCEALCPSCGLTHPAYVLPRAPFGCRWCTDCGAWHRTRDGEIWAHWTPHPLFGPLFGRARVLFSPRPDSPVIDLTEIFDCSGQLRNMASKQRHCNRHNNHLGDTAGRAKGRARAAGGGGGGGSDPGSSRRSRKKQGRRR